MASEFSGSFKKIFNKANSFQILEKKIIFIEDVIASAEAKLCANKKTVSYSNQDRLHFQRSYPAAVHWKCQGCVWLYLLISAGVILGKKLQKSA